MEGKPEEKKGLLTKLKENIDDHDEQMQVLGAAVRLGGKGGGKVGLGGSTVSTGLVPSGSLRSLGGTTRGV